MEKLQYELTLNNENDYSVSNVEIKRIQEKSTKLWNSYGVLDNSKKSGEKRENNNLNFSLKRKIINPFWDPNNYYLEFSMKIKKDQETINNKFIFLYDILKKISKEKNNFDYYSIPIILKEEKDITINKKNFIILNIKILFQSIDSLEITDRTGSWADVDIFQRLDKLYVYKGISSPLNVKLTLTYFALSPIYNEKIVNCLGVLLKYLTFPEDIEDGGRRIIPVKFKFGDFIKENDFFIYSFERGKEIYPNNLLSSNEKKFIEEITFPQENEEMTKLFKKLYENIEGLPLYQTYTITLRSLALSSKQIESKLDKEIFSYFME